jgi:DNA-3-methyladenine glycosylase I
MEKPTTYCEYVRKLPKDDLNRMYHDTEYGFPLTNDNELFGRLILEINQAGLSWTTILKKKENFRKSFDNFDIKKISKYQEKDIERLLEDSSIIRNKLKINAVIFNAEKVISIQKEYSSFYNWLMNHQTNNLSQWVKLFKKTFKFTGGEITKEFLLSIGILSGAHVAHCPVFLSIKKIKCNLKTND